MRPVIAPLTVCNVLDIVHKIDVEKGNDWLLLPSRNVCLPGVYLTVCPVLNISRITQKVVDEHR